MRIAVLALWLLAAPVVAEEPLVDVDEHLGAPLPGELRFSDPDGRPVTLGEMVRGEVPTLLVPSSYECPMLCGLVLKGLIEGLRASELQPGRDVRLLTVSFDPRDTPAGARAKQENAAAALAISRDRWPFLSGVPDQLDALTKALGYRVAYDAASSSYAHPAAIVVLTPRGVISRYLYGIEFSRRDLRLAVSEAAAGRQGSAFDRILLACVRFDPVTRHYAFGVAAVVEVAAALLGLVTAIAMVRLFGRELRLAWREQRRSPGA